MANGVETGDLLFKLIVPYIKLFYLLFFLLFDLGVFTEDLIFLLELGLLNLFSLFDILKLFRYDV